MKFIFPLFLCSLFYSCEWINPAEDIPGYIYIDSIKLSVNNSLGPNTSKITDAWIYHAGELVGVYDLPATIPVLKKDSNGISIGAGIKHNGKVNTRITYPFYKFSEQTTELRPGVIDSLDITVSYFDPSNLELYVLEDFEFGNSFEKFSGDTSLIKIENEQSFEGSTSGYIYMDTTYNEFEIRSLESFQIPNAGSTLFLEMDYKCSNNFSIGILVDNGSFLVKRYKITLVDKEDWNKIYINLSTEIYGNTNNEYQLIIGGVLDNNKTQGEIYIDNLKLIGFKQ